VGRRLHLGAWLLRRSPTHLVWEEARPVVDLGEVVITAPGAWHRGGQRLTLAIAPPPADPRGDDWSVWLDAAAVAFPLVWRPPRAGERWRRLGASGSQTIAKTLGAAGIASRRRAATPVLADGQGVVWIPGIGPAERTRLTAATTSAWRLVVAAERAPLSASGVAPA
jgi:hypothetical protein